MWIAEVSEGTGGGDRVGRVLRSLLMSLMGYG